MNSTDPSEFDLRDALRRTLRGESETGSAPPLDAELLDRLREALSTARHEPDKEDLDATSRVRTELQAGHDELLKAQRRVALAERLAALGAMAARVAHELGTPLHSIAGHLHLMLQEQDLPDAARDRATIVAGEVDRLAALIRRQLIRLRAPESSIARENLNELVCHVRALMEPTCTSRGIRIAFDVEPGTDQPVLCDRDQIEQVLLNLVQNAIDSMQEGGILTLRSGLAGKARAISVSDTGCGIELRHLDRVFEPFFSTKAPDRGTGLGLALCRDIARAHHGDLVLDSKVGLGTVVTLTLAVPDEGESRS